uniref:1-alkyl-2-acetylglycerophosphocholine esterase n=1 Tax=Spongospora subterranea TaxID=70186 RepID=A0A0H5QTP5_9EUKA|eukprot:CRZ05102.1 hypothetical protein [Spongospora subterranea]
MLGQHWIERAILFLGFLDLFDALSWVVPIAVILLLSRHNWRISLSSMYLSIAISMASRLGILVHPSFSYRAILLILALLLLIIHPLIVFPPLTGPYHVGCITTQLNGVDVRIFHPCVKQGATSDLISYLEWRNTPKGIAKYSKMPSVLLSHMSSFRLRSYRKTPVSDQAVHHPVIIFSHGLAGTFEIYSSLVEEWASRGFITVAINHADGSAAAFRSPDSGLPELYVNLDDSIPMIEQRRAQLAIRVDEVQKVLTALIDGQHDSSLMIDTNAVFMIGHSFGATTALASAHVDERFKAVVALDLWGQPLPETVLSPGSRLITVPILHVVSDTWRSPSWYDEFRSRVNVGNSQIWHAKGALHASFSDVYLYSPILLQLSGRSPSAPTEQVLSATTELSSSFILGTLDKSSFYNQYPFMKEED